MEFGFYQAMAVDYKKAISKFHAARELALIRKNNLGRFYKFVKTQTSMTAVTLKTSEGAVVTDPGEKAEVFNDFFSVFTSDDGICASVVERIGGDGLSTVTFIVQLHLYQI